MIQRIGLLSEFQYRLHQAARDEAVLADAGVREVSVWSDEHSAWILPRTTSASQLVHDLHCDGVEVADEAVRAACDALNIQRQAPVETAKEAVEEDTAVLGVQEGLALEAIRIHSRQNTEAPAPAAFTTYEAVCAAAGQKSLSYASFAKKAQSLLDLGLVTCERKKLSRGPGTYVYRPVSRRAARSVVAGKELRPYQVEGRDFLAAAPKRILADEMGLGKTCTALAALDVTQDYPALVVCPASVKDQWAKEARSWTPSRSASIVESPRWQYKGQDIVIVNPERLMVMQGLGFEPRTVILDEAHQYRNPGTKRSGTVTPLCHAAKRVWMLTGTPIANRRDDLSGLLRLLDMHEAVIFHAYPEDGKWFHASRHRLTIKDTTLYLQQMPAAQLHAALNSDVMLRRVRREVAAELPDVNRIDVTLDDVSKEYDAAEAALVAYAKDLARRRGYRQRFEDHGRGFALIQRMRMAVSRAKVETVASWAQDRLDAGERAVIFTEFIESGDRLLKALPGRVAFLHGSVSARRRRQIVDGFEDLDFIIATTGTTSHGVDGLHKGCHNVAFLDLGWTPTIHTQSEGRVNRGLEQDQQVQSWYFVANDTIDIALRGHLDEKFADQAAVVDGAADESMTAFLGSLMRIVIEQSGRRVDWKKLRSF